MTDINAPTLYGDVSSGKKDRLEHWKGIFKQPGVYRKLEYLFYRTLCPYPDQTKIGMWWYGVSGRIAGYFHKLAADAERINKNIQQYQDVLY